MNVYRYRYVLFLTTDACMDAGGTIPWMESVESSREQRPRTTHDHKDVGNRVTPGAITEDAKAGNTGGTEKNRNNIKPSLSNRPVLRALRGNNLCIKMA